MSEPHRLIVACDTAFAMPTAVTLRSVLLHADVDLVITVLHDAVSPELRARVEGSLPSDSVPITWIDLHDSNVVDLPKSHLSQATYFRLLAPSFVTEERFVYLDSDIVARRSIGPLWDVDLEEHPIAAVRSINSPFIGSWSGVADWKAQGLDPQTPYFNAGVLVVDAERWKAADLGGRVLQHLRCCRVGANLDQEALNVVLRGDWMELAPTWNQQTPIWHDSAGAYLMYERAVVEAARDDPVLVHYLDRPKPWHRDCLHPLRDEWRQVAAGTKFAPVKLERASRLQKAGNRIRRSAAILLKGR